MMSRFIMVLLLVFYGVSAISQEILQVGDRIPLPLQFSVLGSDEVVEKLPGQHRLTIIDFWSHSCTSCIASFPKIDKLQLEYGREIEIILVNPESRDSTENFFNLRDWIVRPNVTMVAGDTVLRRLFEFSSVPFIVWLDHDLIVKHMTGGVALNSANVQAFLNGELSTVDSYTVGNYKPSMFDTLYVDKLEAFSYLAKHDREFRFAGSDIETEQRQISIYGASTVRLIRAACEGDGDTKWDKPWQIDLRVKDTFPFVRPKDENLWEEWYRKYAYTYQLRVPRGREKDKYDLMKSDLKRFFPLNFYLDTVRMPAYVLTKKRTRDKLHTLGGKAINTFRKQSKHVRGAVLSAEKRILQNQPYAYFTRAIKGLVEQNLGRPFVDLVDYSGNIDVTFDSLTFDFFTLEGLQEELDKYGLQIIEKVMPIPILVIENK